MAWDTNQWRAVVNTVMNLLSPQKVGDLLTGCIASLSRVSGRWRLPCDSFNTTPTSLIVNSIRDGGGGRCHVLEEVPREKKRTGVMSVRPHGTRLPLDGFSWNFIFELFRKSVMKIQVSLTSTKNNRYFIWRRFHIHHNISLNSS